MIITKWNEAVLEKIRAPEKNKIWDVVELPRGRRSIGCKWVLNVKSKTNGTIGRYKTRLVAKGCTRTYVINYTETFASVAKLNTIRVILSLAANLDWSLQQRDINNTFLNGELEEVFVMLPPGFCKRNEQNKVCKLNKSLYDLKESPRAWFDRIVKVLRSQ